MLGKMLSEEGLQVVMQPITTMVQRIMSKIEENMSIVIELGFRMDGNTQAEDSMDRLLLKIFGNMLRIQENMARIQDNTDNKADRIGKIRANMVNLAS
jgi:methyl-accepting chemotaxis protein